MFENNNVNFVSFLTDRGYGMNEHLHTIFREWAINTVFTSDYKQRLYCLNKRIFQFEKFISLWEKMRKRRRKTKQRKQTNPYKLCVICKANRRINSRVIHWIDEHKYIAKMVMNLPVNWMKKKNYINILMQRQHKSININMKKKITNLQKKNSDLSYFKEKGNCR